MGGTQQPRRQHADRVARLAPPPIPWGPPASSGNRSGDAPAVRPPSTPPPPWSWGALSRCQRRSEAIAKEEGERVGSAPRWSTDGPRRLGADPSARRATLEVGMAQTLPPAPPPAAVECRGPAYFLGADYPSWMRRVDPARGSYTAASATLKPSPTTRCYLCTYCYLRGRGRGTRTVPRGGAAATAPPRDAPRRGSQPPWVGHSRERAVTDHHRTPNYSAVVPRVLYICRFRRNTSRLSSTPFSSMSPPALLDPLSSATTAARSTCGAAAPTGWRSAACWRTRCGLARKNTNTERGRNQGKRDWASVPTAGHQTARGASKQGALFPPGVAQGGR